MPCACWLESRRTFTSSTNYFVCNATLNCMCGRYIRWPCTTLCTCMRAQRYDATVCMSVCLSVSLLVRLSTVHVWCTHCLALFGNTGVHEVRARIHGPHPTSRQQEPMHSFIHTVHDTRHDIIIYANKPQYCNKGARELRVRFRT